MEEVVPSTTKGVLLTLKGESIAYLLFVTESTVYSESSSATFGMSEASSCVVIAESGINYAAPFVSHKWFKESRKHSYTLSFSKHSMNGSLKLEGKLNYEFTDGVTLSDSSVWESSEESSPSFECTPLSSDSSPEWLHKSNGTLNLPFDFKLGRKRPWDLPVGKKA